jgi:asparagine synthase (glutamine-hydrolysing)
MRFVALIWDPRCLRSTRAAHSHCTALISNREWLSVYSAPGVCVVQAPKAGGAGIYPLSNSSGVTLGIVFSSNREHRADSRQPVFDGERTNEIVSSGGQYLIDHYWGSYVSIISDAANFKYHVIREPTGNFPCYYTRRNGLSIFFSHVEDCTNFLPVDFNVNRSYLARWLVCSRTAGRDTGLTEIQELSGGERVTLSGQRIAHTMLWDPVRLASTPRMIPPDSAATELRSAVQSTVHAWASRYGKITHKLSGGLDSSIVAACLANAPSRPSVTYLNFSISAEHDNEHLYLPGIEEQTANKLRSIATSGDERYYARLVSERWGVPLIEKQRSISMDLRRMWDAPLTTAPSMYFTSMEVDDAEIELVKSLGTQAFFSGQAGDSVFLATMQPLAAIDFARLHGMRPALWPYIKASSILCKDSVWKLISTAFTHGVLHRPYSPSITVLQQPTLLCQDVIASLSEDDFDSPWAKTAEHLPPGKQNHLAGLAGSAYSDFVFHSGRQADHIDPLNSQPIWELALQLPTYTMLTGGVSRGLARRAFSESLPPEIRRRQVKGAGTSFYQQIVRKNMGFLSEALMDGFLVREGYLDRQKLANYFSTDDPFAVINATQVLIYLAAEAWLQRWAAIREASTQRRRHPSSLR